MRSDILFFLKKAILPFMFLIALLMFFFDFVMLSIDNRKTMLTGFNLFNNTNIESRIWIILVFALGVIGFIISWLNGKISYGIGFLIALAAIILLIVAQFSLRDNLSMADHKITHMVFEPAYWICLIVFALAGSRGYLMQNRNMQRKEKQTGGGVVNINIITESNNNKEK